jgi:hypothetical protein
MDRDLDVNAGGGRFVPVRLRLRDGRPLMFDP